MSLILKLFSEITTKKQKFIYVILFLLIFTGLFFLNLHLNKRYFTAPLATTQTTTKIGLDLLNNLDKLPNLRKQGYTYQVSSHDKTGLDFDGGHEEDDGLESYHYQENGKYVIFDQKGPGSVTRVYFSWAPPESATKDIFIQFYFDGETEPRVNMSLANFFSGTQHPFIFPLVGSEDISSGGYFSHLPMPFSNSLKIVTTGMPSYYNITFEKYSPDFSVTSFTGQEDVSQIVSKMQNPGQDPKPTNNNIIQTGTTSIPAGSEETIFQYFGEGVINSIKINIPQIVPAPIHNRLEDEGRVFDGSSTFRVKVDPSNTGIKLIRRLDFGIPDQSANVYVDGALAGTWTNAGSDSEDQWRDSSFEVPSNLTTGKLLLQVTIQAITTESNWNEYYYWIESKINGEYTETDRLDVGRSSSETSHQYQVTSLISSPTSRYTYPPLAGDQQAQQQSREILTKTKILGYWDGQTEASVDAPLGAFFGSWAGETNVKSLMMGMDPEGFYYSYYPMPFDKSAVIKIKNESTGAINNLSFEVAYDPNSYPGLGETAGYFNATSNQELPTTTGKDYSLLNVNGNGHVVGSVLFAKSLPVTHPGFLRTYLEGDERIHIDGSNSPSLYGTGHEEYFNSGWYFRRGVFSLPTHGNPIHFNPVENGSELDETGAYRLHLADAINFRSNINFGLEHGDPALPGFSSNTVNGNYYSLTFWYGLPSEDLTLTDELDVATPTSEQQHGYTAQNLSNSIQGDYYYEGDADDVQVFDNGHTALGTIQFNVTINPFNNGVILRRRADQGIRNQQAIVKVGGVQVGIWYDPGRNTSKRWLDSQFVIPASATLGKSSINISLEPQNQVTWSAYRYWVYTIQAAPNISVNITSPTNGATVSKTVTIAANVSSEPQIEKVEFFRNANLIDTDITEPYSIGWKTSFTVENGNYQLTAKASDIFGNIAFSSPISVKVANVFTLRCPDFNGDSVVTGSDLFTIIRRFGESPSSPDWNPIYDLNGDGAVNAADIYIVIYYFGETCS